MLYFDSNEIKEYFTKYTVFEMENTLIEFKLNMKALFNTNFHLDLLIRSWFFLYILDDELLLFSDLIVWSIDNNIDVIA